MTRLKPIVAIMTCSFEEHETLFYKASDRYVRAINDYADSLPFLLPCLGDSLDIASVLKRVDGILFTGSPSNISPLLYGGDSVREGNLSDEVRDSLSIPLLLRALDSRKPILCICRGHQELNVALGGTLHQFVHELPNKIDHRKYEDRVLDESYRPRHGIMLSEGGRLARLNGGDLSCSVNSLHSQAIADLADGLFVEAVSDDGVIEGVSMDSGGYVLSVQWHPEHAFALEDKLNRGIFSDFRENL